MVTSISHLFVETKSNFTFLIHRVILFSDFGVKWQAFARTHYKKEVPYEL